MSRSRAFIIAHDYCYVVEQNRDAQLRSLLVLETSAPKEKLRSILVLRWFPAERQTSCSKLSGNQV